ncbi:MAG: hypothetical protein ACYTGN_11980 [Planctomycetota bacterium]
MHLAALLLVAQTYALPSGLPAPDAVQQKRIDAALAAVRGGGSVAVRQLALVGDVAIPAVVKRLNAAPPAERLLLLAALRPMKAAAPLVDAAKKDPSPAVRAWAEGAPAPPEPDLRRLAARYLDLLALAEEKRRVEVDVDLKGMEPRLGRPIETFAHVKERMRDRRLADQVQYERKLVAARFARAGALLQPTRANPVFMAYLALLREESGAALFYVLPALVDMGERLVPVLEPLLEQENHDPRRVLRVLFAVRADKGVGLYERFDGFRPDTQRALVKLAHGVLAPEPRAAFYAQATRVKDGSVRAAALEELLALPAPAGAEAARDVLKPGADKSILAHRRAALLLARAGVLEPLAEYAEIEPPDDKAEVSGDLGRIQRACIAALRDHGASLAERFLRSSSPRVRYLGAELETDGKRLLQLAYGERDAKFARHLGRRAAETGDEQVAREAVAFLRRGDTRVHLGVLRGLRRRGFAGLLAELAPDEPRALDQLSQFEALPAELEPALLALPDDPARLEALLPLETKAAQAALDKATADDAIAALAGRSEITTRLDLRYPLLPHLEGASPTRLVELRKCAMTLRDVEPGFFHALYTAWERVKVEEAPKERDSGPPVERAAVLRELAHSRDLSSARLFLAEVASGRLQNPPHVLGALKAAARLLAGEDLAALGPLLEKQVQGEYARKDREAPPYDAYRFVALRGGIFAAGYARTESLLPLLARFVLDPKLQPSAFDFDDASAVPYWALHALRHFDAKKVDAAFRDELKAAEADGRLAKLHPRHLLQLVRYARENRDQGRGLAEVRLALAEVVERLPWEGNATYEKMRALGSSRRYGEAAKAARAFAEQQAGRGYQVEDGLWTPRFVRGRARLYDGLEAGAIKAADFREGAPFLKNLAAWYLLFTTKDQKLADTASEQAVQGTAGLYHPYRDTLAALRIAQKRPDEALRLLDDERELPVKREPTSGWHLYFLAQARLQKNDARTAYSDLEQCLGMDRRLIPQAKKEPAFQDGLAKVLKQVEDDYVDTLFAWGS